MLIKLLSRWTIIWGHDYYPNAVACNSYLAGKAHLGDIRGQRTAPTSDVTLFVHCVRGKIEYVCEAMFQLNFYKVPLFIQAMLAEPNY